VIYLYTTNQYHFTVTIQLNTCINKFPLQFWVPVKLRIQDAITSVAVMITCDYSNLSVLFSFCSCRDCGAVYIYLGHAITQAVGRWVPTAAARVRARVWQVGFVVDKLALG
jgi:hypothetical protein